jgi:hypothetical protein
VPAVHQAAVGRQDDRVPEVGLLDPVDMLSDHSAGDRSAAEPAVLVELADGVDRHWLGGEIFGQLPQAFGQVDGSAAGHGTGVSFGHRIIITR